ncbi:MAG: UDP-glucose 4-epimerase GalE [Helicobacteraceae bacterium]|nr:UDP-glucose 4-epimerase GalE [Helicobacteraceae bacterium]
MKNILFTGACGYIGSHTAYSFLKHTDYDIIVIDNLSSGFVENIDFLQSTFKDRISFIKIDLSDSKSLENVFMESEIYAIVHFAASIVVSESVSNPLLYYSNNTKNTLDLIKLCTKFEIKNFIFSSTAAVYGEPENNPISEDSPLLPINPYGASKMMSEMILRDTASANQNFNYIALRYFNVAGALNDNDYQKNRGLGQRNKNATHLIKIACECAVGKRDGMQIFGDDYETKDGTCIRDYIHIDDLAMAHLRALEFLEGEKRSEVFNVGYNNGYSVKEIISRLKEISKVDFKVEIAKRREGDPANLVSNNTKILNLTSWKAMHNDIDLILKSAYLWEKSPMSLIK